MIGAPMAIRRHAALLALLAIAAPLVFAFTLQDRLASFGDDSVSYLVLARWFEGAAADPALAPWAAYQSHFPPLLPLLLWATHGAHDYWVGYMLVAACAVVALPLIARFASRELGSDRGGLAITVLFLLLPTAWMSLKGILSESLYLLTAMACLLFHAARLDGREPRARDSWLFGLLLAAACLARAMGILLVAAFALHLMVRWLASRRRPAAVELVAFVPPLAAIVAWHVLRPTSGVDTYARTAGDIMHGWIADPGVLFALAARYFASGWIASFAAQDDVSMPVRLLVGAVGIFALAGLALRLARNRLDAWFVLASLAVIFPWVFAPENTRRLLYPLLPLLLLYAAGAAKWIVPRVSASRALALYVALGLAIPAVSAPALMLLARKAVDDEIVIPGYPWTYREVTEYYTTVNLEVARERAKLSVVTMGGLEAIDAHAAKGARVMWMRPEYVALLARRPAAAYLYRWSPAEFAAAVKRSGSDYVITAWLYKTDLEGRSGPPHLEVAVYTHPEFSIGDIFVLARVDAAALDAYLATAKAGATDRSR
jgi:hypothetical protein